MIEMQRPEIKCVEVNVDTFYARFEVEPLERGFGITLGNSLRRILLSSLPGYAINSIKSDGVTHEFTTIPGVTEDVTDLVLNLKQVCLKSNDMDQKSLSEKSPSASRKIPLPRRPLCGHGGARLWLPPATLRRKAV